MRLQPSHRASLEVDGSMVGVTDLSQQKHVVSCKLMGNGICFCLGLNVFFSQEMLGYSDVKCNKNHILLGASEACVSGARYRVAGIHGFI